MVRPRDASLRTRLVLLTLASSSVGLVLAFALFAVYDEHLFREHKGGGVTVGGRDDCGDQQSGIDLR